jgi:hypothetical protein
MRAKPRSPQELFMYSENGVLVDFAEVTRVIETAEVFVVGFSNIPQRLIVDTRSNASETPLVQVVEPSSGARQRIAWLKRRRPTLGEPESFMFFPWPHSAGFMQETGIWDQIVRRVVGDYDPPVRVQCELAIAKLQQLEHDAMQAVLRGDNCLTLWPRDED